MVDNFELIKHLLEFKEGEFYFLQILKRKKENPEQKGNSRVIKTYYINSLEYFESIYDEIKLLCIYFNARAYIGLNRRNYYKVAMYTLKEITDLILNNQFEAVRNAFNTCCGQYTSGDKYWIVDLDTKDLEAVGKYIAEINSCQSGYLSNFIATIPTINGYHIITRPFNLKQLEPYMASNPVEIHKNNPTLLYFKQQET